MRDTESSSPVSEVWDRYDITDAGSLAPVFRDRGCAVYVLEFADGEFYVGKTTEPVGRFTSHVRRWGDVVAIRILDVVEEDLDRVERATIADRRSVGWRLRNIKHNPGHEQPASLDDLVSVVEQKHWALGHADYGVVQFVTAAERAAPQPLRMLATKQARAVVVDDWTVGDAVLLDLAAVVEKGIPEAVLTEGDYWTISDNPATSGGRLATLNAGDMEVLYFPRQPWPGDKGPVQVAVLNLATGSGLPAELEAGFVKHDFEYYRASGSIDQVVVPVGLVNHVLQDEGAVAALRRLVLSLMRSGTTAKFRRWHSAEVARLTYAVIAGVD